MTSPLTPNEQNARTRAATYGVRPDLFEKLQEWMVQRQEMDQVLPLLGFGSAYALASGGLFGTDVFSGSGWHPFDVAKTAMTDCHLLDDGTGIVFDRAGLWEITCQAYPSDVFSIIGAGTPVRVELRVFSPSGDQIDARRAAGSTDASFSLTCSLSTFVSEPGSYVRLWCAPQNGSRGWRGGSGHNHLTVRCVNGKAE